jgi:hypothetical protein
LSVIQRVDALARESARTRSNYLARLIRRSVDAQLLPNIFESIIEGIRGAEKPEGDEFYEEFGRGQLHAAKWVVSALLGESRKDQILHEIRRRSGKPIPHIVGRDEAGNRAGFDSDAG